jgi:hypothetical protein
MVFQIESTSVQEDFGYTPSRAYCIQGQPVTCYDLSVVLYWFDEISIDSSKVISDFPEVLNCNRLLLKLNQLISN